MMTRRVFLFSTLVNKAMLLLKAMRIKFMIHLDVEHLFEEDRGQEGDKEEVSPDRGSADA